MENSILGIVTKSTGSWYEVLTESNGLVPCRLRGKFRFKGSKNTNPVVVGDRVALRMEEGACGYITEILPRKNYIDRKSTKLSKINHLIAANVDQAFLVATLREPRTSPGFIDRFLMAAEGFRIPSVLLFNKMDIYDAQEKETVGEIAAMYQKIGYETLCCSTKSGEGLEAVKQKMRGNISLFSGHSGAGKSAIIHAIFPHLELRIGEISAYHQKGKHTTTFAQMHPAGENTFIIDTPGIKEFGLIQYSPEEIRDYFPEIRGYNNLCRFNNCRHLHEPGCAVVQAVENGDISLSRYRNYLAILQDEDMKLEDWELR